MVDSGPVLENQKIWIVMHVKIYLLGQTKIGLFIVHYRWRECRSHLKDNHTSCWRDYYPVARRWFHIWLAWAGSLDGDEKQSLSSQVFRPDFRSLIHFLRRHCQSLVGVRHISCELPPYALETALASRQIHDSRQSGRRRCQLTEEVWRILTQLENIFCTLALVKSTKRFNTICLGVFRKVQQIKPFSANVITNGTNSRLRERDSTLKLVLSWRPEAGPTCQLPRWWLLMAASQLTPIYSGCRARHTYWWASQLAAWVRGQMR